MKIFTCTEKQHADLESAMCAELGIPHKGKDCVGTGPRSRAWLADNQDTVVTAAFAGKPGTEFPITAEVEAAAKSSSVSGAEKAALTTAAASATEKDIGPKLVAEKPVDDELVEKLGGVK